MNADQFVFWLEGFIQTAPGVTDQSRNAIQAKIDEMRGASRLIPSSVQYRAGVADRLKRPLPAFVAHAEREGKEAHFPHIGTGERAAYMGTSLVGAAASPVNPVGPTISQLLDVYGGETFFIPAGGPSRG